MRWGFYFRTGRYAQAEVEVAKTGAKAIRAGNWVRMSKELLPCQAMRKCPWQGAGHFDTAQTFCYPEFLVLSYLRASQALSEPRIMLGASLAKRAG